MEGVCANSVLLPLPWYRQRYSRNNMNEEKTR
jgi:hypothetical protein